MVKKNVFRQILIKYLLKSNRHIGIGDNVEFGFDTKLLNIEPIGPLLQLSKYLFNIYIIIMITCAILQLIKFATIGHNSLFLIKTLYI